MQNKDRLEHALANLESYPGDKFLVLFGQGSRLKYKGLYFFNPDVRPVQVLKVCGDGPAQVQEADVKGFFKYSTAQKEFAPLSGIKGITATTDGIAVKTKVWKRLRQAAGGGGSLLARNII